jgi:hypothetical protein
VANKYRVGRWNGAYITEASITQGVDQLMGIDLSLRTDSGQVAQYFMELMRGSLPPNNTMGLHLVEDEFICAWCASPNPITNRHCGQCGAPRGFIING